MNTTNTVDHFLSKFLVPPTGSSPQEIKDRLLHWIAVANNPQEFIEDTSPYALAAKRRSARQNARRLAQRYPQIAEEIAQENPR